MHLADKLKVVLNTINEDRDMINQTPLVEIINIHAIENRGKKDERVKSYDLCDYLCQVVINTTPDDETETYDVMIDFKHSSRKLVEFKELADAKVFYRALVDHLMGKSENHVFDILAYNGR